MLCSGQAAARKQSENLASRCAALEADAREAKIQQQQREAALAAGETQQALSRATAQVEALEQQLEHKTKHLEDEIQETSALKKAARTAQDEAAAAKKQLKSAEEELDALRKRVRDLDASLQAMGKAQSAAGESQCWRKAGAEGTSSSGPKDLLSEPPSSRESAPSAPDWRAAGPAHGKGSQETDNAHLPLGDSIAILLVGVTRPMTPAVALVALQEHVLNQYPNAHVFVHSSPPPWDGADSTEAVRDVEAMYRETIGAPHLRHVVITDSSSELQPGPRSSSDAACTQGCVTKGTSQGEPPSNRTHECFDSAEALAHYGGAGHVCVEAWFSNDSPRPLHWQQFLRLRDLYPSVLHEEQRLQERYSHMVRMRTDLVFLQDWSPYPVLRATIPPESDKIAVPLASVQYARLGTVSDAFWIASRSVAWASMVGFAHAISQPHDRRAVHRSTGCAGAMKPGVNTHAGSDCFVPIWGRESIWPEARLRHFFQVQGVGLESCCVVTGAYGVIPSNALRMSTLSRELFPSLWRGSLSSAYGYVCPFVHRTNETTSAEYDGFRAHLKQRAELLAMSFVNERSIRCSEHTAEDVCALDFPWRLKEML